MQIYTIQPDVERYRRLYSTEGDQMSKERFAELSFNGKPKEGNWTPPHLKWIKNEHVTGPAKRTYEKTHKIPDIAHWYTGALILNPKATSLLKPAFGKEAEFLQVPVEDEMWTILHVTNMQDAIDMANCRFKIRSDGTVGRMLKLALDKTKIKNAKLFRLVGKTVKLYTSDGPGSFKEIVEKNQLTGLSFDEC